MSGSNVLFDVQGPRGRRLSLILSIIAAVILLLGAAWIVSILAAPRESGGITVPGMFAPSRWDIFADPRVWYRIWLGALATLQAAAVAAVGAVALGIVFSLLRSATTAWIRIPTTVLLEFFRGMPVLLMMLFILLVGSTGAFWAVVIALIIYNGALIGEALRAGLAALPRGQREAGLSLGMRPLQSRMLVEFPQAFRQMLPIIVAQLVVLLKDTSLGYIVGYPELLRTTMNNLASLLGNRYLFSLFVVTLVIYLIMNLSLSWFARWLSRRTASGGTRRGKPAGPPPDLDQAVLMAEATALARSSERTQ
ncbi:MULTISPECIES: amino acid ABC transporter permease [unclassified Leifsonia]|uniref:amino acid ABC transporter permease n=1 Tax=unclassified Leifsonia TaxID=2663824 RepID=UPI0006F5EBBF|nr:MULTISPECIES: amino acid ABC transporter permease [unclassified Leifsonia]KQX05729.1 polar amino acid ABC transporter permease [Leifsonia sp. Root1293]KRA09365.1 polar amino acid ABC transporter permease [Leifsonia sp. Root60]